MSAGWLADVAKLTPLGPTTVALRLLAVACVAAKLVFEIDPEMLTDGVPEIETDPETGCVVCQNVPLTGILAPPEMP